MSFRSVLLATACCAAAPALAWALPSVPAPRTSGIVLAAAPVAVTDPAPAATPDPVGTHAAIAQAQERLAEIDATITVLQEDADKIDAAGRERARAAVAGLRAIRDTYKKEIDGMLARGREMTAAQLAVAKAALTAPWTQFEQALDLDVAAIKLDAAQRKDIVAARIRAEQNYWISVVADLKASVADLTVEQRAAIDARIAHVEARASEAKLRLTRLGQAGQSAWATLKRGFVNSRQVFDDTYQNGR